ncbi:cell envelope integrity protein TolA [Ideonella margarita]|uniref:Cell envelope integrity protein TolA n=1 Tax=Ideonella margarita TaxID=2984191 RepID=A0ABU9C3R2_9BURK
MSTALDTLSVPRESLRPPSADQPRFGLLMSLMAHAGLVTALTLGVQWRTEEPAGVEAELWAATPELAAPRTEAPPVEQPAVEPPPPPPPPPVAERKPTPPPPPPAVEEREAQIAIEKAEKAKLEKKRQEEERQAAEKKKAQDDARKKKEEAQKREHERERDEQDRKLKAEKADKAQKADKERRDKLAAEKADQAAKAAREDQIRRMNAQLGGGTGAPGSTGTAARDAGPSAGYAGRIKARIKPNIVLTDDIVGNPIAEVEVRLAADGTIIGRKISKTSGSKAWDDTVLRAIDRTAILPRDTNGKVEPVMLISFKPVE